MHERPFRRSSIPSPGDSCLAEEMTASLSLAGLNSLSGGFTFVDCHSFIRNCYLSIVRNAERLLGKMREKAADVCSTVILPPPHSPQRGMGGGYLLPQQPAGRVLLPPLEASDTFYKFSWCKIGFLPLKPRGSVLRNGLNSSLTSRLLVFLQKP